MIMAKLSDAMRDRLIFLARYTNAYGASRDYRTTIALEARDLIRKHYPSGSPHSWRHVLTRDGWFALNGVGYETPDVECPTCGQRHYGHVDASTECVDCLVAASNGYGTGEHWVHGSHRIAEIVEAWCLDGLNVCADCGASTAVGTPDPHECEVSK